MKNRKGFTLIEILIVIGIITVLATAVVVVLNPAKRFEDARDKQREIHLQTILSAVGQKRAIEGRDCDNMPDGVDEETSMPIFKTIGTTPENAYYDLFSCLVPIYLDNPLYDPEEGSEADTKYQIWRNPYSKRVTVLYVKGEKKIVAGPKDYWILGAPTVVTTEPVDEEYITHTSARAGGEVTSDGGAPIWERGVIWGTGVICDTETGLTILNDRIVVGSGLGAFEGEIIGLTHDTEYCARTYARNDIEAGYGIQVTFKTLDAAPGVQTLDATDVTPDQATLQGQVTSLGPPGVASIYRYFKWAEARKEDYNEGTANKTPESLGGLGEFSHTLYDLETGKDYSFQACAENSYGERCGKIKEFYTEPSKPLITTKEAFNIGAYEATSGGIITNNGGKEVIARGICFAKGITPAYPQDCLSDEDLVGNQFEITMSGLSPGTKYWVFAFAKNEIGEGFGETLEFTTFKVAPILNETKIGAVDHHSADLGGNIFADGGAAILEHGVCWAIGATPVLPHNCLIWNGGQEGVFTYKLKNFLAGTTYNVRAFARNEKGIGYGPLADFTTVSPAQVPKFASTEVAEITQTTAKFKGIIQNHGGAQIISYGFCWSKVDTMPTPEAPPDENEGGCQNLGSVSIGVSKDGIDFDLTFTAQGLSMGTRYYARAFAQNSQGYGYGWPKEFTTKYPDPPSVVTHQVDPATIIGRTAWAGGEITGDGGDPETIGGICYSSFSGPTYPARTGDPECTIDRQGKGIFTSQMTGLIANYTYYYRAYAHNTHPDAPAYGAEYSFVAGSEPGVACSTNDECKSDYCVDGVCCKSTCEGNCNRCNVGGSLGICTDVASDCTGNCDYCDSGNCSANAALCAGNCDTCLGSGTAYNCAADVSLCDTAGNCEQCSGSGTAFNCGPKDADCTGNCDVCSGTGLGPYNCAANATLCTGNCDVCSGSGTAFSCAAKATLCTGNCAVCSGSGTAFSCAADNTKCSNTWSSCYCSGSGTIFNCRSCGVCKNCSNHRCSVDEYTNWGAGFYGCARGTGNNMQRCYDGDCKRCSDGGGKMLPWAGTCSYCTSWQSADRLMCWRVKTTQYNLSCTNVCGSFGGCVPQNWDDTTTCQVCQGFFPTTTSCSPNWSLSNRPRRAWVCFFACWWQCQGRHSEYADNQSCSAEGSGSTYRLCICRF